METYSDDEIEPFLPRIWTTANRERIAISDMTTVHLRNAIRTTNRSLHRNKDGPVTRVRRSEAYLGALLVELYRRKKIRVQAPKRKKVVTE